MSILNWPRCERPREKLLEKGASTLSDAELLALFLRTGTPGKSAVDLARDLLTQFGNLRHLFCAKQSEVCHLLGVGRAKYAQLQAVLEISRRYLQQTLEGKVLIGSSEDTKRYLTACLRDYPHEVFACLFLDTQHQIICFDELFHGTLGSAPVHPREVVKRALKHNAAAVILAHNHPSGLAKPSEADKNITELLKNALRLIDVSVIDHIIIGEGEIASFAELGLL